MQIDNPLVVMFRDGHDHIITHIYPEGASALGYAMLIADLARHVAAHFCIDAQDVMTMAQAEINNPTTGVQRVL